MEQRFGHYRLDELIGRGGMGEVWRAYDTVKERVVALKRLPPSLAADADFQARFRRESKIAARLREPHIIPIHDFGEIDGQLFIDMRLVEGVDLHTVIDQYGPLHPVRAVDIISQVAAALDAAHRDGLIHRDIKPSNVLLGGSGNADGSGQDYIYLIDFGVARASASTALTATGTTIGTFEYIAPERLVGGVCDHRVDVYALGCLLYETLTGQKPFAGEGIEAQMYAHIHTPPPAPSQHRAELPVGFDGVIASALAKNPEDRYPSAGDLVTAARTALRTPTRTAASRETSPGIPTIREAGAPPARPRHPERMPGVDESPPRLPRTRPRRPVVIGSVLIIAVTLLSTAVWLVSRYDGDLRNALNPPTAYSPSRPPLRPSVVATISLPSFPLGVALSPDGRTAYVTSYSGVVENGTIRTGAGSVFVIDTTSNAVTATIAVTAGTAWVAFSPDGRLAYVTNGAGGAAGIVSVLDTSARTVTATIPVAAGAGWVTVSPDGRYVYASGPNTPTSPGVVSVIDTLTNSVTATIPVGMDANGLAVTGDGKQLYAVNKQSNTLSVIDTANNTVTKTIPVGASPNSVEMSPDGKLLYVPDSDSNDVSVIDTATDTVSGKIPVGNRPARLAIVPNGLYAYVTNSNDGTVSVIDTGGQGVTTTTIGVGAFPLGLAITPDGTHVYVANNISKTISVIDTGTARTSPPPRIVGTSTYVEGPLVYARINFIDGDGDRAGFGFQGVNGAGWAAEQHPFSNPSYGRVAAGHVDYPFNLECGHGQNHQSDVQFYVFDNLGRHSDPVTVHLACG